MLIEKIAARFGFVRAEPEDPRARLTMRLYPDQPISPANPKYVIHFNQVEALKILREKLLDTALQAGNADQKTEPPEPEKPQ